MKVLFFRGIDGNERDPEIDESLSDESTTEYKASEIVNVERDSDDNITIYSEDCGWYLTITQKELDLIKNPTDVRPPRE